MFKRKRELNLAEIREYTQDLERITVLRNKAIEHDHEDEAERYTNIIEVMQLVYMELNQQ